MNRRNKEKQAGFSLVEVVVSTAILFSVAGAFLAMTAANGKLLAREHSLVQGAYELSALAQKGEGSPTGETFEVIFQGNEGDALEVQYENAFMPNLVIRLNLIKASPRPGSKQSWRNARTCIS